MITIKDIAEKASCSIATVSMVLNNRPGVAKKTREKVEKVIEELNYSPNIVAKALKTNKFHTIALMVGNINNPYFSSIINGCETVLKQNKYHLIIANIGETTDIACENIDHLMKHGVDGIIITWCQLNLEPIVEKLKQAMARGIKVIGITEAYKAYEIPYVSVNEKEAIENILTRLVAFGHKHIAIIGGGQNGFITQDRVKIFKDTLNKYGVFNEEYIAYTCYSVESGEEATINLLTKHPEITAIMGITDTIAIGIMEAVRKLHLKIPEEISVVGIDGIKYVRYFSPKLTSIDAQGYEIGTRVAEKILVSIEKQEEKVYPDIKCNIVEGDTIGKAPIR